MDGELTHVAEELLAPFPGLDEGEDPLAKAVVDAVVASVTPAGTDPRREALLPAVLVELAKADDAPSILPKVRDFLRAGSEIDPFIKAHLASIERAQRFFDDHGVLVITALFHASLPEAYLAQRGVQVLDKTGELWRNWTRRAQETGQFLINVLSPTPDLWRDDTSSLSSGQFAAIACRRVRLVHAAIRWMLREPPDHELTPLLSRVQPSDTVWRERLVEIGLADDAGGPLNQEDLLATLGTFTTVVFDALDKLAVSFDEDDQDAFYLLWNIVGWHLGIGDSSAVKRPSKATPDHRPSAHRFPDNHILPLAVDQLDAVYRHLAKKLQHPTDQGRRLAKALMQELAYPLPTPIQGAPAFVARYLIGDTKANHLGIEQGGYAELLFSSSGLLWRAARATRVTAVGQLGVGMLSKYITDYAIRAFISQARWSERGLKIDPRVASRWGFEAAPPLATPPP